MIFLISDLHFNHFNISRYCNRPIDWQERVIFYCQNLIKPDDTVIHLGDFGLGSWRKLKEIFDLLPGHWITIVGNHDRPRVLEKIGFEQVLKKHGDNCTVSDPDLLAYDVIPEFYLIKDNSLGDPREPQLIRDPNRPQIAISHQPFAFIGDPYFYGHIHNSPFAFHPNNDYGVPFYAINGQNVSLEVVNYKPVPLPVLLFIEEWYKDHWSDYFISHFGFDQHEVENFENKEKRND